MVVVERILVNTGKDFGYMLRVSAKCLVSKVRYGKMM